MLFIYSIYEMLLNNIRNLFPEKLFVRINRRTGRTETNLLEWERSWESVKILKYPSRYGEELRSGVRNMGDGEKELAALQILPRILETYSGASRKS